MAKRAVTTKKNSGESEQTRRIEELEQEVKRLRYELKTEQRRSSHRTTWKSFFRGVGVWFLVLVCVSLLSSGVVALWLKSNITNTDVWVAKTSELIEDPYVRGRISTRISEQIIRNVDAEQSISEILPERVQGLAVPLTASIQGYLTQTIDGALSSERFLEFWQQANRSAHSGIIDSLRSGGAPDSEVIETALIYISDDELKLNLKVIFQGVQNLLVERGLTIAERIPIEKINGTITLASINNLPMILWAFNMIDRMAAVLIVAAFVTGAGAVLLAIHKRRTVMAIGWLLAGSMVVVTQTIFMVKYPLINAALSSGVAQDTAASEAVFSILTDDLVTVSRTVLVSALLLVLAAFMTGTTGVAASIKQYFNKLFRVDAGRSPALRWIHRHRTLLLAGISALAVVLLIFPIVRSTAYVLTVVSVAVILAVVVAILAQSTDSE